MSSHRQSNNLSSTSNTTSAAINPLSQIEGSIVDYDPDWDSDYEDLTGAMGGARI